MVAAGAGDANLADIMAGSLKEELAVNLNGCWSKHERIEDGGKRLVSGIQVAYGLIVHIR